MINWYPGHMAKAKRLIKENRKLIDIVYILIDSRMPKSSLISDFDDIIGTKKRIYIFTKYDLCDKSMTDKWINEYSKSGDVLKVDLKNNIGVESIIELTKKRVTVNRKIRALVIGVPNVGKSTLINKIVSKKAVNVGNKAGITKGNQWIRSNEHVELMDTPGLLWPKLVDEEAAFNLASLSSIKEEVLPIDDVAIYIMKKINNYYPGVLEERYNLSSVDFEDIENLYDSIGRRRGALVKNNEVDYDKVSKLIITDLRDGYLGKVTFDRYE
jgi:ribosome biogenesis GTPase A